MTEHNLGKWEPGLKGRGKTFTINGHLVAVFNIDGKLLLLMMNARTWVVLWAAVKWKGN